MKSLGVGSDVTVYVASVRAVARIVSVSRVGEGDGEVFGMEDEGEGEGAEVMFGFEFWGMEWMEMGAKVLVVKSGGGGREGFVGKVVERVEA